MTGRNDLCPCGSGKKYKKCCLLKSNDLQDKSTVISDIRKELIQPVLGRSIPDAELPLTQYELKSGHRSRVLGRLDQLTQELQSSQVRDGAVISICNELYEKHEDFSRTNTASVLTANENRLLITVVEGILTDFACLSKGATPDYGAMHALAYLTFQAMKQGISDATQITRAIVRTDTGDTVVDWELFEGKEYDIEDRIWIDIESKDELENQFKIIQNDWYGLSVQSQKTLATAMTLEHTMASQKSAGLLSYQGIAMSYLGVIEEELRYIIFEIESWPNEKRMMWRDLSHYCHTHSIPIVSTYMPDLGAMLTELLPIRNKAAHVGFVSKEELEQIKGLVLERNLLSYLSWAKIGEEPQLKTIRNGSELAHAPKTKIFPEPEQQEWSLKIPQLYEMNYWFERAAGMPRLQFSFSVNDSGMQARDAFSFYKKAAENGGADAAFVLAQMYFRGRGTPQDYNMAKRWYEAAANKGNRDAQFMLGTMLLTGELGASKPQEALKWLLQAGERGHVGAIYQLTALYTENKESEHAWKWTKELALRGYKAFQFNLACKLEAGDGVHKNMEEAIYWYIKAARQGWTDAQFNLGVLYAEGVEVEKNIFEAMKWFRNAAERGDEEAKTELKQLMSKHAIN